MVSVVLLILMAGNISKMPFNLADSQGRHFEYTSMKGFFLQDEMDTDDSSFDGVDFKVPFYLLVNLADRLG